MPSSLQDISLLMIASCILLLALINMYLVWRLIKGVRFEDEKLDGIVANSHTLVSRQFTLRQLLDDPGFKAMLAQSGSTAAVPASENAETMDPELMRGMQSISDAALGFGDLIDSLGSISEKDFASWKAANQARINELLTRQQDMRGEVEQLQRLLTKANATVLNLRATTLQDDAGGGGNTEMQKQIETLKAGIAARDTKLAAAEAVLKNEKTKFEDEKKKLQDRLAEMQASFDRTLVEKNFIEDAFLVEAQANDKAAT